MNSLVHGEAVPSSNPGISGVMLPIDAKVFIGDSAFLESAASQ